MSTTKEIVARGMEEWRERIKVTLLSGGVINFVCQEERDRTYIVPITRQNISFVEGIANVPSEMFFEASTGNGAVCPNLEAFIDKLAAQKLVRDLAHKGYNPVYIKRMLKV